MMLVFSVSCVGGCKFVLGVVFEIVEVSMWRSEERVEVVALEVTAGRR